MRVMAARAVIPGPERSEERISKHRRDYGSGLAPSARPGMTADQREWKLLKHAGQTTRGYGGALFGTAARR